MKIAFIACAYACSLCTGVCCNNDSLIESCVAIPYNGMETHESSSISFHTAKTDYDGKCYWMYCEEVKSLLQSMEDKNFNEIVANVQAKINDKKSGWTWSAVSDGTWDYSNEADDKSIAYKLGRLYQFAEINNNIYLDEHGNIITFLVSDFLRNAIADMQKYNWVDTIQRIKIIYTCINKIKNENIVQQCIQSINDCGIDKFAIWLAEIQAKTVGLDLSNVNKRYEIMSESGCTFILGEIDAVLEMLTNKFVLGQKNV